MGLQAKLNIVGGYVHTSGNLTAQAKMGGTGEPAGTLTFADGTSAGQANFVYAVDFSIAATTTTSWDLKGGGGELDTLNRAMAATAVKMVLVEITTPAASTSLRWGPQGVSNAAQLWFQALTANFYDIVTDKLLMADARAGWAVGAGTNIVSLYNPGASAVAGKLRIWGCR